MRTLAAYISSTDVAHVLPLLYLFLGLHSTTRLSNLGNNELTKLKPGMFNSVASSLEKL